MAEGPPVAPLRGERSSNEEALSANHKAEKARQRAREAQWSAADSLARSADSQDRIAQMYEERSAVDGSSDYSQHAACHRQFAEEDRRMAQKLREAAGQT